MKKLKFTLNEDGTVRMEASGFVGRSCTTDSKAFEDALGLDGKREYKPEFYQAEQVRKVGLKQ